VATDSGRSPQRGGAGSGSSPGIGTHRAAGASAAVGADAEVAAIARAGEPDRHLAALLAPAPEREGLLALAAFAAELARIPLRVVREPVMGEIRLEWWRKALLAPGGEEAGQRVAEAMREAIRRHHLPAALIDAMIDARALELAVQPFADDAAVADYLWRTEGALFALAGGVMGLELEDRGATAAFRAAGHAYGLTRLLLGLPRSLSMGRVPLAASRIAEAGLSAHELLAAAGGGADSLQVAALMHAHIAQIRASLAEARRHVGQLPRRGRVVVLPLALVEPYVRQLERQFARLGGGALREEVQVLPLIRVWRVATAHLGGL
jgi:phytoene synthase